MLLHLGIKLNNTPRQIVTAIIYVKGHYISIQLNIFDFDQLLHERKSF